MYVYIFSLLKDMYLVFYQWLHLNTNLGKEHLVWIAFLYVLSNKLWRFSDAVRCVSTTSSLQSPRKYFIVLEWCYVLNLLSSAHQLPCNQETIEIWLKTKTDVYLIFFCRKTKNWWPKHRPCRWGSHAFPSVQHNLQKSDAPWFG